MKKKDTQSLMVRVSALAVLAAPALPAMAQTTAVNITCKQNIFIGKLMASGCKGTYIIGANGKNTDLGCLIINSTAKAGACTVTTTKGPATKSAVVKFSKLFFTMTGSASNATMVNLRMQATTGTKSVTKITFTPTQLQNTPVVNIGGSLKYADLQTAGKYSGSVKVSVDWK